MKTILVSVLTCFVIASVKCSLQELNNDVIENDEKNFTVSYDKKLGKIHILYAVGRREPVNFWRVEESGGGVYATYVLIKSIQDSDRAIACIKDGGLHQNHVSTFFEAVDIMYIEYFIEIYSY
ncbi:uncharacterized protein LOC116343664 [Contarinia nasturtii]|uniref:uncharacterized protein LOC116343664 n=1 Tax=Contarinia nasturtii TaxID=265458 RepID=UPI0012D3FB74|nr:uncharacterized protein LOC116343664 [Contarinia nasturtii]